MGSLFSGAPENNLCLNFGLDVSTLSNQSPLSHSNVHSQADIDELTALAAKNPDNEALSYAAAHPELLSSLALKELLVSPEAAPFALAEAFSPVNQPGPVISLEEGEIPYLIQWDSRWAFHNYGSSIMAYTACGPTCLSMAVIGLTGNTAITPPVVADFAAENGYYVPGAGTAWSLFTEGASYFGLTGTSIEINETTMRQQLKDGAVLIASVLPGDFTRAGHLLVISDYSLGGFQVYDPNSPAKSAHTWSYRKLAPQIGALWALTV